MGPRACNCSGVLALVLDAFYDRTRGWRNTRYERRRTVRTHAICPDCGQTWRLTLERTDGRERYLKPAGG